MDELGKLQESFEKLVRVSADSRNELAAIRIQQSNLARRQSEQEKIQEQIERERNEYQDKQQGIEVQLSKDNQFFQEKTLKATKDTDKGQQKTAKNTEETNKTLLEYLGLNFKKLDEESKSRGEEFKTRIADTVANASRLDQFFGAIKTDTSLLLGGVQAIASLPGITTLFTFLKLIGANLVKLLMGVFGLGKNTEQKLVDLYRQEEDNHKEQSKQLDGRTKEARQQAQQHQENQEKLREQAKEQGIDLEKAVNESKEQEGDNAKKNTGLLRGIALAVTGIFATSLLNVAGRLLAIVGGITALGFILSKTYNYLTRDESDVSFSDLSESEKQAIVNKYQSLFNEDISNNAAVLKQLADIERDALDAESIVNVEDFREGGPRRDELRRIAGRTATLARTEQIVEDPLGYATLDDLPEPKNFLDRLKNFFIRTQRATELDMMNYTPFMYSRMVDDMEKIEGGDTSPVTLKSEENALEKTEEVNTSGATPPISVSNVDNSQHLIKPDNSAKTMYRMFPMHHFRAMG